MTMTMYATKHMEKHFENKKDELKLKLARKDKPSIAHP